jgi:glycosyltransferase involved in cell wall biosynthesis
VNTQQVSSVDRKGDAPWPVMVLAHNEEKRIKKCLDSIYAAEPGRKFAIFVMANGCTDSTEALVREYGKTHEGVSLVSIDIGCYCNAWNVFIHETIRAHALDSDVYFFMDGDGRVWPGSFSEMAKGLAENPEANAAGSVPKTGRSMEKDTRELIENRSFVANLYCLRGRMVRDFQAKNVRLPVKMEGDDGIIGALVKWDLDPRQEWNHNRIVSCPKAGFLFDPVSPLDIHAWRPYLRRLIRYGRRRYEFDLLRPRLKKMGLKGLPQHISEIYHESKSLKLRWQGIYTITNFIALMQLRKYAK